MFGTEGDGEENGNGLSAVFWSFLLASIAVERVGYLYLLLGHGGPSQRKPIENSFWLSIVCNSAQTLRNPNYTGVYQTALGEFFFYSGKK